MVDSEKDSTVIQAANSQSALEPKICPEFQLKKKKNTNQILVSQEHEKHTDVADVVYCSAPVWMELFRNSDFFFLQKPAA